MKVLITGAANGIGLATAKLFLSRGHEVIGFDIEPPAGDFGVEYYNIDVTEPQTFPNIEGIDIVISSAGVLDEADVRAVEVNLLGCIAICEKYAVRSNIKAVLNIASISAHSGMAPAYYTASQGGIYAYTKGLALNLAKYGAVVNSISPGGVITRMNRALMQDAKLYADAKAETLLGKWATAEEVAELIYFMTAVNKSITGQDIIIDNGEAAKYNFIAPKTV